MADTINFTGGTTAAVAPGTFVIVAGTNPPSAAAPSLPIVGTIFRVGNQLSGNQWQLQAGADLKNWTQPWTASTPLSGWVVGQGDDPPGSGSFSGGAQDIMVYSTFVLLR